MYKINFKINSKIEFISEEGGHAVSLIQDVRENYFMVSIPMKGAHTKMLSIGEEVDGFYYDVDHVYMFTSKVLDRAIDNIPLYKLNIPNSFKKVQRRNFVRLPISIPILYTVYNDKIKTMLRHNNLDYLEQHYEGKWQKGHTWDLSGGGAKINVHAPLKTEKTVYIILKSEDLHIGVKSKVIRCMPHILGKQITYHIGLEFMDISERKRDQIIRFIFVKLREIKSKNL